MKTVILKTKENICLSPNSARRIISCQWYLLSHVPITVEEKCDLNLGHIWVTICLRN